MGIRVENLLSEMHNGAPALLTSSCTHALEMATMLIRLGPGDEVIMPSFTFPSLANAVVLRGARPRFIDVEEESLNVTVAGVSSAVNDQTKAIFVVNYGGLGTDLPELRHFADERNLWLVEDNAHGLGGHSAGQTLGTFGHLSATSFHQTKNFSAGEGGALIINSSELFETAQILREKGTDRAQFFAGNVDKYTWVGVGSSWVLSEVAAALLVSQLTNVEAILERQRSVWNRYFEELHDWAHEKDISLPPDPNTHPNTGHIFYLLFNEDGARDRLIEHLSTNGIVAPLHYQPLHRSSFGSQFADPNANLHISDRAGDNLVRLPMSRALTSDDVSYVIECVKMFS